MTWILTRTHERNYSGDLTTKHHTLTRNARRFIVPFAVFPTFPRFPAEAVVDRLNISVELDSFCLCIVIRVDNHWNAKATTASISKRLILCSGISQSTHGVLVPFSEARPIFNRTASRSLQNARIFIIYIYTSMFIFKWKKVFSI